MKNFNVFKGYQTRTVFDSTSGSFIDVPMPNSDFLNRAHVGDKTRDEKLGVSQLRQSVQAHRSQRQRTARQAP
jgi:hypothetical protein